MRRPRLIAAALVLAPAPGGAAQSVHEPASAAALAIHELGIGMYAGAAIIFLLVLAMTVLAVFGRARAVPANLLVIGGGIVAPVAVLSCLLLTALLIGKTLSQAPAAPVARIQLIAHQWWWEVRYLPPSRPASELAVLLQRLCASLPATGAAPAAALARDPDAVAIVLANELRIPVGHVVDVELTTADVIHSFWVPALGGKVDMIPGRINRLTLRADRPGVFRGQCAEYCGGPHGLMGLMLIAEAEPDYREWLQRQAQSAREPASRFLAAGRDAFLRAECAGCHSVRGTTARGAQGPDLTHVGSRHTIAAATLDNHVGTLAGWIADPQALKPGNRMPPSSLLTGVELRAVASYLASLD